MAKDFSKILQKTKRTFDNIKAKIIVRVWNLAKRLDQSHSKDEKKKKKGKFSKLGNK